MLFRNAHFEIVHEDSFQLDDAAALLRRVRVNRAFKGYSENELRPTAGNFVLRKRKPDLIDRRLAVH